MNDQESTYIFTRLSEEDLKECEDPTWSHLLKQIASDDFVTLQKAQCQKYTEEKVHFFCGCIRNMRTEVLTFLG